MSIVVQKQQKMNTKKTIRKAALEKATLYTTKVQINKKLPKTKQQKSVTTNASEQY